MPPDEKAPSQPTPAAAASSSLSLVSEAGTEFEALDQLGPMVQSILKSGKQDLFLDQLGLFIKRKEAEIERLCSSHFEDFLVAVDSLVKVRQGTRELRDRVIELNDSVQESGNVLIEQKTQLMQARKVAKNVQDAIDVLQKCLGVLATADKCKTQLENRNLFAALRTMEDLEHVQLRKVAKFSFAKHLEKVVPVMREAVQMAVIADLKEWFYNLRNDSRMSGMLAMKQARNRQARWRRLSQQRQQQGFFSSVIELIMDEENEENLVDNDQVRIDFRPLYQCIRIHEELGRVSEFRKAYADDRQAQIDLYLSSAQMDLSQASGMANLEKLLHEVVGFFVVEHVVVYTTHEFRSKPQVDVVWTVVSDRVTRLIVDAAGTCDDVKRLFEVRKIFMSFITALESYLYDARKPREILVVLSERYASLNMAACGERFKQILSEDEYRPMRISSQEELMAVFKSYKYEEDKEMVAKGFPRTVPFSASLPLCMADIKKTIMDYYQYVAGEDGQASVAVADTIIQAAVDKLIGKTIAPLLMNKLRANELTQVVQVLTNLEHFDLASEQLEQFLFDQKISRHDDEKVVLRSKEYFRDARKRSERRVFELVNKKLDQFLEVSNYDWTPQSSLFQVSQYLVDLITYLKDVLPKIMIHLPMSIKSFVYLDAMDHLAGSLNNLLFGPQVTEFNSLFIAVVDIDLSYLERFVKELNDPNLLDTFTELRQTVDLLMSENREEYLDLTVRNRKYNRLKPGIVIKLFEK